MSASVYVCMCVSDCVSVFMHMCVHAFTRVPVDALLYECLPGCNVVYSCGFYYARAHMRACV